MCGVQLEDLHQSPTQSHRFVFAWPLSLCFRFLRSLIDLHTRTFLKVVQRMLIKKNTRNKMRIVLTLACCGTLGTSSGIASGASAGTGLITFAFLILLAGSILLILIDVIFVHFFFLLIALFYTKRLIWLH